MQTIEQNASMIELDFQWLQTVIEGRIHQFINTDQASNLKPEACLPAEGAPPALNASDGGRFYGEFIQKHDLTPDERLIVLLALAPEIKPELLDRFLIRNSAYDKTFSEFGGITTRSFNGFIPTIQTALFLLGGRSVGEQLKYRTLFDKNATLFSANILRELRSEEGNPISHRQLALSDSALSYILTGEDVQYEFSADFPARRLSAVLEWDDLVLPELTALQLKELLAWPAHGKRLITEFQMAKHIQPGYRALFHGPSGTGKTLTAALIGKRVEKPVYRIDISQLVSKYIGETEKNLEKIFTVAENRDWILFFDEADALFGKRTGISSSNDRFANQETAYLLQRIEVCKNIVILATNLKANMDEAYTRRFQSVVYFPMPEEEQRLRLWRGAFSNKVILNEEIDLKEIAKKYDITGGSIVNVVRYASLMAAARDSARIIYSDLIDGIRREYSKLGRTL
ncbi:MAG TPA: ATP-binding protein [Bacillota bacterium]|nr:ATP-binding protein [Bacillota bacterium]